MISFKMHKKTFLLEFAYGEWYQLIRMQNDESIHDKLHTEVKMCSSRTRMMFFKIREGTNADFTEQRRNEAFVPSLVLEKHTADENKHFYLWSTCL